MEKLHEITQIDEFFINKLKNIVDLSKRLRSYTIEDLPEWVLRKCKKVGFGDGYIADCIGAHESQITYMRNALGIKPSFKKVDTCAGEFKAVTPYYYSTYDNEDEVELSDKKKVIRSVLPTCSASERCASRPITYAKKRIFCKIRSHGGSEQNIEPIESDKPQEPQEPENTNDIFKIDGDVYKRQEI